MYIVTGKTGTAHVTGEDDAAFNSGVCGTGCYVLPNTTFRATLGQNGVTLGKADLCMKGVFARVDGTEVVPIAAAPQGLERHDLIVARYLMDSEGIESVTPAVIQGTAATSPRLPDYNDGDYYNGATTFDMPLVDVWMKGPTIYRATVIAKASKSIDAMDRAIISVQNLPKIMRGSTSLLTIPAGGNVSEGILFGSFTAAPTVTATLRGGSGNAKYCTPVITAVSTTEGTITVYNTHTADVKMYVDWIAAGR